MQILVDENNIITAYATVGGFDGSIEIDESIVPDTFKAEFKNGKFLYIDGVISYNRKYDTPQEQPNRKDSLQQEVDSLRKQVEELTAMLEQLLNKE